MISSVIMLIGVFITSLFGMPTISRVIHKLKVPFANFFWIAIGITMICSKWIF